MRSIPIVLAAHALWACSDEPPGSPLDNEPPVAELSVTPTEGTAPLWVVVLFSCSDPDGTVIEHRVDIDSDGFYDYAGGPVEASTALLNSTVVRGECTDDEGATSDASQPVAVQLPPSQPTGLVQPEDWTLPASASVRFRTSLPPSNVVWAVNGMVGGNPSVGTIDAAGLYTAPPAVPGNGTVMVTALTASTSAPIGTASVRIVSTLGTLDVTNTFARWTPRVLSEADDSVTLDVVFLQGYPTGFELDRGGLGDFRPLLPFRSGTWRLRLSRDEVLQGYREGDLHAFVGFLHANSADSGVPRRNLFLNVRDGTVPDVTVQRLAVDVQTSPHVVNIRYDRLFPNKPIPAAVTRRFYDLFPDDFDLIAIVEQVDWPANRSSHVVKNTEGGLGRPMIDQSAERGSAGRLRGFIDYPLSTLFDLGETGSVHEVGHQWMVSIDVEGLAIRSGGHWARGSAARGIMGTSGPSGGVPFPFEVVPLGGNEYELRCTDLPTEFNDLELYLMGLLPADSVGPHVVFDDPQIPFVCGSKGTATSYSIDDIVAKNGPRVPAYPDAPTEFRIATIVLSQGRLLTDEEMAFFDHMAARGSAVTPLPFTSGFLYGTTKPFFLATGGRAVLVTRISNP